MVACEPPDLDAPGEAIHNPVLLGTSALIEGAFLIVVDSATALRDHLDSDIRSARERSAHSEV
jgi:hypothetical protein